MTAEPTVTVAGAGALGLVTALALADAGWRVTLADPSGANASGVAAGMLAPAFEAVLDDSARPHFEVLLAARNLWPALEARAGVRLDRAGALGVGPASWLAEVADGFASLGLRAAELPRAAAEALTGGLPSDAAALLTREDWRLSPAQALGALRAAAQDAGVELRTDEVRERGEADWLVIATGASTTLAQVAPELAALTPIKGHILRLPDAAPPAMTIRGPGVYIAPANGGVAVGATMEAGVGDPVVDPAQGPPLLAAAARVTPRLTGAAYELQAGVRGATPDGLPLAGLSRTPRVAIAAGARRNGWLLAPLVARAVVAQLTGAEPGPFAARLDPRRFGPEG
ncbi:NAD(P)/FAD-dependent oxidoreductase [Phenylobacterium sp.]|jgi:glycine oxidase|uniref:NAD(P)/FAD-dependent oxidoreductase n=1 Tax=Phenylobacterium sp. TaxID=1871053 RepID=UPI003784B6BE